MMKFKNFPAVIAVLGVMILGPGCHRSSESEKSFEELPAPLSSPSTPPSTTNGEPCPMPPQVPEVEKKQKPEVKPVEVVR